MSNSKDIIVAVRDFTTLPGARYKTDGTGSAEEFFDTHLIKILDEGEKTVIIDFDGTWGYASSFLSELALKIVETLKTDEAIHRRLQLKSEDEPGLIDRFWGYINESLGEEI